MSTRKISIAVMLSLALGGFTRANPAPPPTPAAHASDQVLGDWIAKESDNICGISHLKRVANPARVDYEILLEATPQVREMRRERIDPESAEGRTLRRSARTLITKASELVRKAQGHCSVWKVIRHKGGRRIPDVTDYVLERF